ncbi:exonuclease domain-containing protein [Hyphococcus sp.]|uniref:exonuclease domain-containing protein n=1 Tax=Hyphococcus sp. TaxID=2038636 RepID=UPI0035C6EF86
MEFTTLDVETANTDLASICQIGVARFANGHVVDEWETLVDPQAHFDMINVSIHGIKADDVIGAPTFPELVNDLKKRFQGPAVVTHTHFDRVAMHQACSKAAHPVFDCRWLDSARVARRTWEEFAWSGYGLANVCEKIGYSFRHHNALEDAKAAGHIILAASTETGLDIEGWLRRVEQPIDPNALSSDHSVKREGCADGPLFGEFIVFTGTLSMTRQQAADLAAKVGCTVTPSVTKKTTLLCVGDQDISRLAGESKSSKHRKAESLINSGQAIRIIRETDFAEMVSILKK